MKKTVFVVNPNAGTGTAGKRWPAIRDAARPLLGAFDARFTRGAGDAALMAEEALRDGFENVVCVGGDGTLNEVVNGLLSHPRGRGVLGYIPCGTGCDFARTLELPKDPRGALEIIASGVSRFVDAGTITYRDNSGRAERRFFINVVSFGLGGEVDDRVNRGSKALGGFLSFIRATLVSILLFRKKTIRMRLDGGPVTETVAWNIAVANGQFHGGGMWVAPDAAAEDGLFNVTVIGDLALWEVFRHLPKLYNGKLLGVPRVQAHTSRRIEAWSAQRVLLDMDGEQPGRLPAVIEMVPGCVRMAAPPPH